jgi:hypothetical protein
VQKGHPHRRSLARVIAHIRASRRRGLIPFDGHATRRLDLARERSAFALVRGIELAERVLLAEVERRRGSTAEGAA